MSTSNDLLNRILATDPNPEPSPNPELLPLPNPDKTPEEPKPKPIPNLSRITKISEHIININPVPIYINNKLNDNDKINKELIILSSFYPNDTLYAYGNRPFNQLTENTFTYENEQVPVFNICAIKNEQIELYKKQLIDGIGEFVTNVYNFSGEYSYKFLNSYIQKYKNGSFLHPSDSILNVNVNTSRPYLLLKILYYINNGDPDDKQPYSGFVSFTHDDKIINLKPESNNLFIWENGLVFSMHPFVSKKNIDVTVMWNHILVEF